MASGEHKTTGWRPIETAPDGPLMLFSPTPAGNVRGGMVWVSGGFRFGTRAGGFRGDQTHEPPTHWMPLPEPPDAD